MGRARGGHQEFPASQRGELLLAAGLGDRPWGGPYGRAVPSGTGVAWW